MRRIATILSLFIPATAYAVPKIWTVPVGNNEVELWVDDVDLLFELCGCAGPGAQESVAELSRTPHGRLRSSTYPNWEPILDWLRIHADMVERPC